MSSDFSSAQPAVSTIVAVPAELIPRLTAECDTDPFPGLRSPLTDAALVIGEATTTVALLWSRKTILALSGTISELKKTLNGLEVRGQFGNRKASLNVSGTTSDDEIVNAVSAVEAPAGIDPDSSAGDFTVFISYARDDLTHNALVRSFWEFLRDNGIDARIDLCAEVEPQDWPLWTQQQITGAKYVLMIASPAFKERAEGTAPEGQGRGVQWEAHLLREMRYEDPVSALRKQLPVVLPGRSTAELPLWAGPTSNTHYEIEDLTPAGARKLLEYLR